MRILLIEPNEPAARSIELSLRSENFVVYTTDTAEEAIDLGKLYDYDAIILDMNLPDRSGLDVIRALRVAKSPAAILATSNTASVEDKVRAFGFGADDFILKPFHRDELVARIHAVVRRNRGQLQNIIAVGNLRVDIGQQRVYVDTNQVHLTAKEYAMLELLALRQGMTVTKDMFLNHIYGGMDEPQAKIIDVFLCKLRNKLRPFKAEQLLQTVWGRGYTLTDERLKPMPIPHNPSELTAQEAVAA